MRSVATLITLIVCSVGNAQQLDSVVSQRGTPTYGSITLMSPTEIEIEDNSGRKKRFPVNEIQKVTFQGEPSELRTAREAIARDQLETARSILEEISTQDISRPEVLQDIAFYKAYCDGRLALVGGGDKAGAVRALRSFEADTANADSYHYYDTMELLGDLAVALASYDNGVLYYGKLAEAPWPEYQLRAKLLQANALVAGKQFTSALERYEEVLQSGRDDASSRELKVLATLGKAVCVAESGDPQEGIDSVLDIIAKNDSRERPQLFARAYNALGTCYLKAGQRQDALLAFLHVDLLFNQTPDAHAEALHHLSDLWSVVNKPERASRARSVLHDRYSGSPWANGE